MLKASDVQAASWLSLSGTSTARMHATAEGFNFFGQPASLPVLSAGVARVNVGRSSVADSPDANDILIRRKFAAFQRAMNCPLPQ